MKSYAPFIILFCITLLVGGCGQNEQKELSEEAVMTSFFYEFFSGDCSYDELSLYTTADMIEELQANRMPEKYKDVWEYSDSIFCKEVIFKPDSDNIFQFTATLSWENKNEEFEELTVEGNIGLSSDDENTPRVNYLYLRL